MARNNESFGIAVEVAIAKSFCIDINPAYEARAEESIVRLLLDDDSIYKIFREENIPRPVEHTGAKHKKDDFILQDGSLLSVKSNQGKLGRVAPQEIGQSSRKTYFNYLEENCRGFSLDKYLKEHNIPDTYEGRAFAFKQISQVYIDKVIDMYWENLLCDYYLHFYNLKNYANPLENYILFHKEEPPVWNKNKFSFTRSLDCWNESTTLKYYGITIGEFQVHNNRDCLKFRFDIHGIIQLVEKGLI